MNEQQYNAFIKVVAQNKSLQGELRQQKELNKKLIKTLKAVTFITSSTVQELEAEND